MAWFKEWFNTPYYHLLYGERDEKEAGIFVGELIRYLKPGKDSQFLDLACGKGRHAIDVAAFGFNVHGIDLSSESIAEAKLKSSENLHFEIHDMRNSYKKQFFDYILNLFTSFGYFEEKNDNLRVLESVYADLKQNGIFVQDYFNVNVVLDKIQPLVYKRIGDIEFEIKKELRDKCILKTISFKDKGCHYSFQEKVSLFGLSDFKEMYEQCGLELKECFGDYKLNPFDPLQSERLVLISVKK